MKKITHKGRVSNRLKDRGRAMVWRNRIHKTKIGNNLT
jgi:hypothetical protein